jgi:hypothetical protein
MVETYFVVPKQAIKYKGLVNIEEFYMHIDKWLKSKSFEKAETRSEEHAEKDGWYIELLLEPFFKFNDYIREVLRIHIHMYNVKDVEVDIDGHKVKLQEADVTVATEGFFITDYENRWEAKPVNFFLRSLIDKYVYRRYTQKYQGIVKETMEDFRANIKSYLNLYRFKVEK